MSQYVPLRSIFCHGLDRVYDFLCRQGEHSSTRQLRQFLLDKYLFYSLVSLIIHYRQVNVSQEFIEKFQTLAKKLEKFAAEVREQDSNTPEVKLY